MNYVFALALCLIETTPALSTSPFDRHVQLSGILLSRLIEVAQHDLRDTHFVEKTLALDPKSPFADLRVGKRLKVTEEEFDAASQQAQVHRQLNMTGDALPLRSGKFWNLKFAYVTSPLNLFAAGVATSAMVNVFDVEEYTCVRASALASEFPGQTATAIGEPSFEFQAYKVRDVGRQEVSLVFTGPQRGPGCMEFLAIWQHAKMN